MALRVVQWTTGNVGQRSVRAVVAHPDLELVGCYAWSTGQGRPGRRRAVRHRPGRRHRDRRRRRPPRAASPTPSSTTRCGRTSTSSSASSRPASTWSARRRSSTARGLGAGRDRIAEGLRAGRLVDVRHRHQPRLRRADRHRHGGHLRPDRQDHVNEGSDTTLYDSPATELPCGFGRPIDDPELPGMAAQGTAVFGEAVAMVADALGVELDDIVCEAEYAQATEDVVMDSWTIADGLRRRGRRQLAGQGRRPHRRRAERPVEEGPDPRSRLDDPGGPRHPGRRAAHREGHARVPARRRTSRPPPSPSSWSSG